MQKIQKNKLNYILPIAAALLLLVLTVILIIINLNKKDSIVVDNDDDFAIVLNDVEAVTGDSSPCRPLQAIYSTAEEEVFDDLYEQCSDLLLQLQQVSRPNTNSPQVQSLYATIDEITPIINRELERYQEVRLEHSSGTPIAIGVGNDDTEDSSGDSSEQTESDAQKLYELYNALRDQVQILRSNLDK